MGFKETKLALAFLITFSLVLNSGEMVRGRILSREEDIELDRQLKVLNKPAIKTIKTEEGQIFDCVDIYKQPALDNPLLKNHTIQLKPSPLTFPKGMKEETSPPNTLEIGLKSLGCPEGSVPIRRIQKKDLIRMKSLPTRFGAYQTSPVRGHRFAMVKTKRVENVRYDGGRSFISLYNPSVTVNQFSASYTWVQNGPPDQLDGIEVGLMVWPALYEDNNTHLFGHFNTGGTGCYDVYCDGFVQVSKDIPLGAIYLRPDTPPQIISETGFNLVKVLASYKKMNVPTELTKLDLRTHDWWVGVSPGMIPVGYWPSKLFKSLSTNAAEVGWGGEIYNQFANELAPPMGSGLFVFGDKGKTAYARAIQVISDAHEYTGLDVNETEVFADNPYCYIAQYTGSRDKVVPLNVVYFGGPGGVNCTD